MNLARGILGAAAVYLVGLALSGMTGGGINSDLVRFCARSQIMETVKALTAAVLGLSLGKTTLSVMSFIALCRMEAKAKENGEDS